MSMIDQNTNRVIATLSVGRGPDDVGIDQATDQVIVANGGSNNVSVISDPLHGCRLALSLTYESAINELTVEAAVGTLVPVTVDVWGVGQGQSISLVSNVALGVTDPLQFLSSPRQFLNWES